LGESVSKKEKLWEPVLVFVTLASVTVAPPVTIWAPVGAASHTTVRRREMVFTMLAWANYRDSKRKNPVPSGAAN
jgi:hypothetical protein